MRGFACVTTFVLCVGSVGGQILTPLDRKEADRFAAVVRSVSQAGYTNPIVVGHGSGPADAVFVLLATEQSKGVLLAAREPAGNAAAKPVVLERDRTPADLGVHGVQFDMFLGRADLVDITITHEPLRLESSQRSDSHHVLRTQNPQWDLACQFAGNAQFSASKGIGATIEARVVTVQRIGASEPIRFDVTTTTTTTRTAGRPAVPDERSQTQATAHYELPASGLCRVLPGGEPLPEA